MNEKELTSKSKFLSYVLRHRPDSIGIKLNKEGWVGIADLLVASAAAGTSITRDELLEVVEKNNKKRFAISKDGLQIRASQGHSVEVDLALDFKPPPKILYHGTAEKNVKSILKGGLKPGSRHDVHMSKDVETAKSVGARHGKPVVLIIDASAMFVQGYKFCESENGVWLTAHVPPQFIQQT